MDPEKAFALVGAVADTVAIASGIPSLGLAAQLPKLIDAGLSAFVETGSERLSKEIQADTLAAVYEILPVLETRVRELEVQGSRFSTPDFARLCLRFAKAHANAGDEKKRRLLQDAFLRSFTPELYESTLLDTLWEILDRVNYGDLTLLNDVIAKRTRLGARHSNEGSLASFHRTNLEKERLIFSPHPDGSGAAATELGQRLYALALKERQDHVDGG